MSRYCLICTPRSGSFYVQRYISKVFDLEFGSEWFGSGERGLGSGLVVAKGGLVVAS